MSIRVLSIEKLRGRDTLTCYIAMRDKDYQLVSVTRTSVEVNDEFDLALYGDEDHFRDVIGKFDPEAFFMVEPAEVDQLDYDELFDLYEANYKRTE